MGSKPELRTKVTEIKGDISEIVNSVNQSSPEELGKEIEEKLKNRIKQLPKAAATYYELLNKEVDITGSKDEEYFLINYVYQGFK